MEEMISELRSKYLELFSTHFGAPDGNKAPLYSTDLIIFGVLDRQIGLLEAMPSLVKEGNIHAVAPLLRIQLDGLLRLHAFRLVESMDDLTSFLLKKGQLRKYKDRNGKALFDRYLVETLSTELPWVGRLYSTLSGWVHLSSTHVFTAFSGEEDDGTFSIGIGSYRKKVPEKVWEESSGAIRAIHEATLSMLEGYFKRGGV